MRHGHPRAFLVATSIHGASPFVKALTLGITLLGVGAVVWLAYVQRLGFANIFVGLGSLSALWALWILSAYFAYSDERAKREAYEVHAASLVVEDLDGRWSMEMEEFDRKPLAFIVRSEGPQAANYFRVTVRDVGASLMPNLANSRLRSVDGEPQDGGPFNKGETATVKVMHFQMNKSVHREFITASVDADHVDGMELQPNVVHSMTLRITAANAAYRDVEATWKLEGTGVAWSTRLLALDNAAP